ncbi:diacylglycerol/lipid kinase family protein [Streptomyces sp. H39-S7]|uniref:diacylglycerol/lipid kinase family protein n=1 Tax=Streptomyces sp. H39-S7 TaxID=3004357 RepID=UPI0022AF4445|nr:diacylglycerol kinase family protein [Streptomyces sp. H39-S7]MCZ4125161.1 diacylglycerol kinase family protein [Streptomyces sp. H39-S7]
MDTSEAGTMARARLLARMALLCALAAVAILLAFTGAGGPLTLVIGLAGLVAAAVGAWWVLAHRGVLRWAGALLAVGGPAAVVVFYARTGLWAVALGSLLLGCAALACARSALRRAQPSRGMAAIPCAAPVRPVLIMNPKSGDGKVGRFGLAERAEQLGARVLLLDTSVRIDVAALARQAVAEGADLLGVAGGDGTQALVAAVAAEHDLPFMVISAGTRNHFAMDLGLDRADPTRCLDALTDAEELTVDLGMVADHPFVNTASFGAYAQVIQDPDYRAAKAGTALNTLPDLLLGDRGERLDVHVDGTRLESQQALLVSNNPYAAVDPLTAGRRPRLDRGTLGVLSIRVDGTAQAAELALRRGQATGLHVLTARQVTIHAAAATVPVAIDGEALILSTPVTCRIMPGVLRVRVPRNRPRRPVANPPLDWRHVIDLALGRSRSISHRGKRTGEPAGTSDREQADSEGL